MNTKTNITGLESSLANIRGAKRRLAQFAETRPATVQSQDAPAPAFTGANTVSPEVSTQVSDMIGQFSSEVRSQIDATTTRVRAIQQSVLHGVSLAPVDVIDVTAKEVHTDEASSP